MLRTFTAMTVGLLVCVALYAAQSPTPVLKQERQPTARPPVDFPHALFDPDWMAGDSWMVRYSVLLESVTKDEDETLIPFDYVYTYTVLAGNTSPDFPGTEVVAISAATDSGMPDWLLTFDKNELVLLRIEEVLEPGLENIEHFNPFGARSWMPKLEQFSLNFVHDFPKMFPVPVLGQDLEPALSGTPGFHEEVQLVTDLAGNLEMWAFFSRIDPASDLEHITTIEWDAHAKWWKKATITLGGTTEIVGERL